MGITHKGKTSREINVSRGCWDNINPNKTMTLMGSLMREANAFAMMLCTTSVSLLIREISSPVLARLKKLNERFCKWSKRRARRSTIARNAAQFTR